MFARILFQFSRKTSHNEAQKFILQNSDIYNTVDEIVKSGIKPSQEISQRLKMLGTPKIQHTIQHFFHKQIHLLICLTLYFATCNELLTREIQQINRLYDY